MWHDDITVRVDWVANRLMQQQEDAATNELRRTASNYRLSSVPSHVRVHNPDAYAPKFVAIGPFHRNDTHLRPAQRLKTAYFRSLISRGHPDPSGHLAIIQEYVRAVADREPEARAFYTEDVDLDVGDFINMMVLDGCSIIEHLVNHAMSREEPTLHATPLGPVHLSLDLILIENQIPFFILVELIKASNLPEFHSTGYEPPVLLVKLVLYYLAGEKGRDLSTVLPSVDDIFHILHLLHVMITTSRTRWEAQPRIQDGLVLGTAHEVVRLLRRLRRLHLLLLVPLLYSTVPNQRRWRVSYGQQDIPCASDLKRMWLQVKKVRSGTSAITGIASILGSPPLAVKLAHDDKLRMPQLLVEFRTAPLLLNLMALEQSAPDLPGDVSAYVSFMAKMVHSSEDAGVLVAAEVLHINSHSMDQVVQWFRQLRAASVAELEGSYLWRIQEKLSGRMWADAQRNYFSGPWAFVVMLIAAFSFVSTVLQTYAFFKQK